MAQVTSGIRAILSHPVVYRTFQRLMGPPTVRRNFVADFIRPVAGMRVLDIGCGPADILDDLPAVEYHGFDISPDYVDHARARFGARGHFTCKLLEAADLAALPRFDVVLALGLLHHLDDRQAGELVRLAAAALGPGGRLVTIDPVLEPGQNPVARFLVRRDRGQNVRDRAGYERLARVSFSPVRAEVRHQAWIPYTHCMMECTRP
jgi:SAM-dependent methyltransferase